MLPGVARAGCQPRVRPPVLAFQLSPPSCNSLGHHGSIVPEGRLFLCKVIIAKYNDPFSLEKVSRGIYLSTASGNGVITRLITINNNPSSLSKVRFAPHPERRCLQESCSACRNLQSRLALLLQWCARLRPVWT